MSTEKEKEGNRRRSSKAYQKDPEKRKAINDKWIEKNPDKRRLLQLKNRLRRVYGMTLEDYDRLLAEQEGVCAVCQGPHVGSGGRFHVDHDHETGVVRGLLCGPCNTGLGQFKDSSLVLSQAMNYLRKFGK